MGPKRIYLQLPPPSKFIEVSSQREISVEEDQGNPWIANIAWQIDNARVIANCWKFEILACTYFIIPIPTCVMLFHLISFHIWLKCLQNMARIKTIGLQFELFFFLPFCFSSESIYQLCTWPEKNKSPPFHCSFVVFSMVTQCIGEVKLSIFELTGS